jgi:hypothetical protein
MTVRTGLLAAGLLLVAACRTDPNSAQGVAEGFVDQYYVRIDLRAAKPFCIGLALKKLLEGERLTAGQTIDEGTRLPLVRYRLVDKKDDGDQPSFVFEGTINVDGAGSFTRKWLVTTRRDGGAWKVSNFEEFD